MRLHANVIKCIVNQININMFPSITKSEVRSTLNTRFTDPVDWQTWDV